MQDRHDTSPGDEQALAALLRAAGPRARPDPAVERQVRTAVEAEWRALVAARRTAGRARLRNSLRVVGAAAAVVAVAVTTWVAVPWLNGSGFSGSGFDGTAATIATVGRVAGPVEVLPGSGPVRAALADTRVQAGDKVTTGAGSRTVLLLAGGMSLRLDESTRLTVMAPDHMVLAAGRVYLDAPAGLAQPLPLQIDTPFGTVRHLGTQYQLSLREDGLQIGVREGLVQVTPAPGARAGAPALRTPASGTPGPGTSRQGSSGPGTARAAAGEGLVVAGDGSVRRAALPRHGAEWAWIHEVTPPYSIEQRPLLDFLRWASRETGRELVFASPALQTTASKVILRGSIAGLTPDAAVEAVMATTPLTVRFDGPRLVIGADQARLDPPAL